MKAWTLGGQSMQPISSMKVERKVVELLWAPAPQSPAPSLSPLMLAGLSPWSVFILASLNCFPCLLCSLGLEGEGMRRELVLIMGWRWWCVQGSDWRGGLVYFAHCFPGGVCKGCVQYTAFTPCSSDVAVVFRSFCIFLSIICTKCGMHQLLLASLFSLYFAAPRDIGLGASIAELQ